MRALSPLNASSSAGSRMSAAITSPIFFPPAASSPWHEAQLAVYRVLPSVAEGAAAAAAATVAVAGGAVVAVAPGGAVATAGAVVAVAAGRSVAAGLTGACVGAAGGWAAQPNKTNSARPASRGTDTSRENLFSTHLPPDQRRRWDFGRTISLIRQSQHSDGTAPNPILAHCPGYGILAWHSDLSGGDAGALVLWGAWSVDATARWTYNSVRARFQKSEALPGVRHWRSLPRRGRRLSGAGL